MGKSSSTMSSEKPEKPKFEFSFDQVFSCLADDDLEARLIIKDLTPLSSTVIRDSVNNVIVFECVKRTRLKMLRCLFERFDWDINAEREEHTVLTYCIKHGGVDRFRYIINRPGINFHLTTSAGNNAVLMSLESGKEEYFNALIEFGVIPHEVHNLPDRKWSSYSLEIAHTLLCIRIRAILVFVHTQTEGSIGKLPFALIRDISSFI